MSTETPATIADVMQAYAGESEELARKQVGEQLDYSETSLRYSATDQFGVALSYGN